MSRLIYVIFGNDDLKKKNIINIITENFRINKLQNIKNYWYVVTNNLSSYVSVIEKYNDLNFIFLVNNTGEVPFPIKIKANKLFSFFLEEKKKLEINNLKDYSGIFLEKPNEYIKQIMNDL